MSTSDFVINIAKKVNYHEVEIIINHFTNAPLKDVIKKMFHCLADTNLAYYYKENEKKSPERFILGKIKIKNVPITLVLSILNNGDYIKLEEYPFLLEKLPLHIIEQSSGLDSTIIRLEYKKIGNDEPETLNLSIPNLGEPIQTPSITAACLMQFLNLHDKLITGGEEMLKICTGPMGMNHKQQAQKGFH